LEYYENSNKTLMLSLFSAKIFPAAKMRNFRQKVFKKWFWFEMGHKKRPCGNRVFQIISF